MSRILSDGLLAAKELLEKCRNQLPSNLTYEWHQFRDAELHCLDAAMSLADDNIRGHVRETLLDQVEVQTTRSSYGADSDGNRGIAVTKCDLITTEASIDDFESDDLVPLSLSGTWTDPATGAEVELDFRLSSLDPASGEAVYAVSVAAPLLV